MRKKILKNEICGVYIIENIKTKEVYVGASVEIKRRWIVHRSSLKRNCHKNNLLQDSWNKHGKKLFKFKIIEECDAKNLAEKESAYIKLFRKNTFLINLTDGGLGSNGFKRKGSSSEFYGVSRHWYKSKKGDVSTYWRTSFSDNGRQVHLGTFKTEVEAAKVFDVASWEKYKNLDKLNFPSNYKSLDI